VSILDDRLKALALKCNTKFTALWAAVNAITVPTASAVTPEQFGAVGDGVTDDSAAFAAMKAHLDTLVGGNIDYGSAVPSFTLGFKKYRMGTSKLSFSYAVQIYGQAGGEFGGEGTTLVWDSGHADHGLEFTGPNWWIDGVAIEGPFAHTGPSVEADHHGINATARGGWGKIWVRGWAGDAVHIEASVANGTNANGCRGFSLVGNNSRNGLRLVGTDVNAGRFSYIDANFNNQAGVLDEGAFGNGYGTIQAADNGITGLGTKCMCFNNGHMFTVADGQASGASTNGPPSTATNNTWWIFCTNAAAATSYAPQWTSGQTWRCGGPIYVPSSSTSNASTVDHLYAEGAQPVVQTGPQVLIKGGSNNAGWGPFTRYIAANSVLGAIQIPRLAVTDVFIFIPTMVNSGIVVDARTAAGGNGGDLANDYYFGNVRADFNFRRNDGTIVASITAQDGLGFFFNCLGAHEFAIGGSLVHTTDSAGINLQSGKVLKVNGTQVVSSRQTVTGARGGNAALASLLTALAAHGLITDSTSA